MRLFPSASDSDHILLEWNGVEWKCDKKLGRSPKDSTGLGGSGWLGPHERDETRLGVVKLRAVSSFLTHCCWHIQYTARAKKTKSRNTAAGPRCSPKKLQPGREGILPLNQRLSLTSLASRRLSSFRRLQSCMIRPLASRDGSMPELDTPQVGSITGRAYRPRLPGASLPQATRASPSPQAEPTTRHSPTPHFPWATDSTSSPKSSQEFNRAHPYAVSRSPVATPSASPFEAATPISPLVEFGIARGGLSPRSASPIPIASTAYSAQPATSRMPTYSQGGAYDPSNWRRRYREDSTEGAGSAEGSGSVSSHFSGQGGVSTVPTSVASDVDPKEDLNSLHGTFGPPNDFRAPSAASSHTFRTNDRRQPRPPPSPSIQSSVFVPLVPATSTVVFDQTTLHPDATPSMGTTPLTPYFGGKSAWDTDDESPAPKMSKKELKEKARKEKEAMKKWKEVRKEVVNRPRKDFGDVKLPEIETLLKDGPRFSLVTVSREVQAAGEKALQEIKESEEAAEPANASRPEPDPPLATVQEVRKFLKDPSRTSPKKGFFRFGKKKTTTTLATVQLSPSQCPSSTTLTTKRPSQNRLRKAKPPTTNFRQAGRSVDPIISPPIQMATRPLIPRYGVGSERSIAAMMFNEFESDFAHLGRKTQFFDEREEEEEITQSARRRTSSLPSTLPSFPSPPNSPPVPVDVEKLSPPKLNALHPIVAELPIDRRLRSKRAARRNDGDIRAEMISGWLHTVAPGEELTQTDDVDPQAPSALTSALTPPRYPTSLSTRPSPSSSQVPHSPNNLLVTRRSTRRRAHPEDTVDLPHTPTLDAYGGLDELSSPPSLSPTDLSTPPQQSISALSQVPNPPQKRNSRRGKAIRKAPSCDSVVDPALSSRDNERQMTRPGNADEVPSPGLSTSACSAFTLSSVPDDQLFFQPPAQVGGPLRPRRPVQEPSISSQFPPQEQRQLNRVAHRVDLVRRTPSLVKTASLSRSNSGRQPSSEDASGAHPDSGSLVMSVKSTSPGIAGQASALRQRLQQQQLVARGALETT